MFYTPNKDDYVVNINLAPGLDQEIFFEEVAFDLKMLKSQKLSTSTHDYFPLVISINYSEHGKNYAFIGYY